MRIAVFGATGTVGKAIVDESHRRGHVLTAVARHPDPAATPTGVATRACDVGDLAAVGPILAGTDAAVLTIRLEPGQEHRLAHLTRDFLDTAAETGSRVLVVGGAGALRCPQQPDRLVVDDPNFVLDEYRTLARASVAQFEVCRGHHHTDWVYLSPPAMLEPGPGTGRYRRGTDTLLVDEAGRSRIEVGDLALAAVDELEAPAGKGLFTVADVAGRRVRS